MIDGMDLDGVAAPAFERQPVSSDMALRRAAAGFGSAVALVALIGSVWHEALDFVFVAELFGAARWLYEAKDRHSKLASLIATCAFVVVGIGAVWLIRGAGSDFPRDVAAGGIGALVSSQCYAAITRRQP